MGLLNRPRAPLTMLRILAFATLAVAAASAVTEKYAGLGETTLTKLFKGDVWTTNLVINLVTGVAGTVVYSVEAASAFEVAKLTSVLWIASALIKLKDNNF